MATTTTFSQYQRAAIGTAIFRGAGTGSETALMYLGLGAAGEAGEIADCIKKGYRDGNLDKLMLRKEIGDELWYLANLCREMGWDLGEIAQDNIKKLLDRKEREALSGSGDDR